MFLLTFICFYFIKYVNHLSYFVHVVLNRWRKSYDTSEDVHYRAETLAAYGDILNLQ